jgi:hypothetical protein
MPRPDAPDADAVAARTAQLVADLVEPAKATALDKLGDGERALRVAVGWVRGKLGSVAGLSRASSAQSEI